MAPPEARDGSHCRLDGSQLSTPARLISYRALAILLDLFEREYKLPPLSPTHRRALELMVQEFACLLTGEKKGRIAFPMPPGTGKSMSILATIAAIEELRQMGGLHRSYSVMVAASRVEALCELIDDFKRVKNRHGERIVPEYLIGLLHAKGKQASMPCTEENEKRPYLFVTHARLRTLSRESHLTTVYKAPPSPRFPEGEVRKRDLLWWDESLLTSDSWSIPKADLVSDTAWLPAQIELTGDKDGKQKDREEAHTFLLACLPFLESDEDRVVKLPVERSADDLERYTEALKGLRNQLPSPAVVEFLDVCWKDLRIHKGGGEQSVITYALAVPDTLDRVAILDASYPIRILEQLDKSITVAEHSVFSQRGRQAIRLYHDVTLYMVKHGGGRAGVQKAMNVYGPAHSRPLSKEIAGIIHDLPEGERVLIVTFKPKPNKYSVDHLLRLKNDLAELGVDLSRVEWTTWGHETSSNRYGDIENVILAGVIVRSYGDLAAAMLGQQYNLAADVTQKELDEARISESAHAAFQAICRTRIRKGKPIKGWIFFHHPERLQAELRKVMPDVTWRRWQPRAIEGVEYFAGKIAETIAETLLFLEESGVTEVSSRALRKMPQMAPYKNKPRRTYTRATLLVPRLTGGKWKMRGQSFVRRKEEAA